MKILITLLCVLVCFACNNKNKLQLNQTEVTNLIKVQDSIRCKYNQIANKLVMSNWQSEYSEYLEKWFPDITIDSMTKSYLVIPTLIIPQEVLEFNNIDMSKYFKYGLLQVNYSKIYILDNNIPLGTFQIDKINTDEYSYSPITFHEGIREFKLLNAIEGSQLYFHVAIKGQEGTIFIPGILFYKNAKYEFLNPYDNRIYPAREIYRAWHPLMPNTKKRFTDFINKLVKT